MAKNDRKEVGGNVRSVEKVEKERHTGMVPPRGGPKRIPWTVFTHTIADSCGKMKCRHKIQKDLLRVSGRMHEEAGQGEVNVGPFRNT